MGAGRIDDAWARTALAAATPASALRRFFEVDAESTVIGTLYALAEKGQLDREVVAKAIKDLGVDPEKVQPQIV